ILIGNNLANIACSSLGTVAVTLMLSESYAWLSTLVLTIVIIIFGETIPKISSKKNANKTALRYAWPIRILEIVLSPVVALVVGSIHLITFPLKGEKDEDDNEEAVEELQNIIETAEDEKVIDEDASELMRAALDFSEISASEAMTARVDLLAIDIDDEYSEILNTIENSSYSRLPVYQDSRDNIIGVLFLNHFLKAVTDTEGEVDIRSLLMPPCYVYKTMKLPDVMENLRKAKQHLAVVVDEYGGTCGVISMEDVLEQIVGDIWDETDTVEEEAVVRTEGVYELDGDMSVWDFLELMDIREEDFDFDSETVGGWTIESFGGEFPKEGDSFEWRNLRVTVLSMEGRRVDRVLVTELVPEKEQKKTENKKQKQD
ncbi:MAG: HlyC/CorC family transporter, partial [Oscillospiraceae bacterium]|nr:HlyC/CorC family transporter [Oscillospiraceae bacterium]